MEISTITKNYRIFTYENISICFSYDKIIAIKKDNQIYLDEKYWNYSRTTTKHLTDFLKEDTKTIKEKIKNEIYKLLDLQIQPKFKIKLKDKNDTRRKTKNR